MINNITVGNVIFSKNANNNVDNITQPIEASVEFSAATAQDAQNLLSDYLRYVVSSIRQEIKAELNEKNSTTNCLCER